MSKGVTRCKNDGDMTDNESHQRPEFEAFDRRKKGRGSWVRPKGRFESTEYQADWEHLEVQDQLDDLNDRPPTEFLFDDTQSIISENKSPDIPFRYSLNPYRGCEHGCSYCYARPTHEYLGLSAGLDFETKVIVKRNAPMLFRKWLRKSGYEPSTIAFSGVTDCYQPAERKFELTRGCLSVADEANQPVGIVTKNALVCRDLDILAPMAERNVVRVGVSVTTLDAELARAMEPRTSTPAARLRAIEKLVGIGVPVLAMVAPIIPGLNDHEIPAILEKVSAAGATSTAFVMLRLPWSVETVFEEWVARHLPEQKDKIFSRIKSVRGGRTNQNKFGQRMSGTGTIAEQISATFKTFARKYQLDGEREPLDCSQFQRPELDPRQQKLF